MVTRQQTARDVVSILDQWCSKEDTPVRTQFRDHEIFLNEACLARGLDRIVNEARLLAREQKSLIDKKMKQIDDLEKEWNGLASKEVMSLVERASRDSANAVTSLTNARKITWEQRGAMEIDIKNLDWKEGKLSSVLKAREIERQRVEEMEKIRCPERTKKQLVLTCKQEGKPRCTTYNKDELIALLC